MAILFWEFWIKKFHGLHTKIDKIWIYMLWSLFELENALVFSTARTGYIVNVLIGVHKKILSFHLGNLISKKNYGLQRTKIGKIYITCFENCLNSRGTNWIHYRLNESPWKILVIYFGNYRSQKFHGLYHTKIVKIYIYLLRGAFNLENVHVLPTDK